MTDEIRPFKIKISDEELDNLNKRLDLARIPDNIDDVEWDEENGVTVDFIRRTVSHWRNGYSWREHEAKLNEMPQFKTTIKLSATNKAGQTFDPVEVHFAHVKATQKPASGGPAIPLIFIHGWPGNFAEVQKALPALNAAGFDVVAPSLMGYGWSSLPRQAGFNMFHHADVFHHLMVRLGYDRYVVQGGDWGAIVSRALLMQHPEHAVALHVNMPYVTSSELSPEESANLTEAELAAVERFQWYKDYEQAYTAVQATKPRTFGFALHDSPVAMLSWMADKMNLWSDLENLPGGGYTTDEYITWTLLHYFPGPTTAIQMYRANFGEQMKQHVAEPAAKLLARNRVDNPVGVSHFPKEIAVSPRVLFEKENNVVFWREQQKGGHFAAHEQPEVFAKDVIEFLTGQWKSFQANL
ncbi:epoxide hydrolase domain-containing protein [Pyricularia oryzae 70-15]|uniref:Epoxide hydrolase domain-containing protein n=3 Tax=Pyricularia oryzae TaxID=318829 RepID=G5EH85_PYRO7|nr:epoxide hydrolase domain-containing protein [Pyricularia oryzae 70-15]ELQ41017.1 epoxide hydrolase domain-containing protein [Pyricularia oryzae Y34]KAI7916770.1 epoxide hydrolase domain-containing protein [Pyricularia oryzae]EAQ71465.1 hypothetical protein MGCH7_ch7g872 [Pyricularia oryzae 70-15]EHA45862.1 epoxide hydrolase domain-containing protein [Pyricularia oryzae 70-15]KAI7922778.1 epoxide hydrolase domain-containing protein [Pyricularia oryzae]